MKNVKFKLIVCYSILFSLSSCDYCTFISNQNEKEFIGIVINKKVIKWDRGKKVLTLSGSDNLESDFYFPTSLEFNDFWNNINLGDSIHKGKNSEVFIVYRLGELIGEKELKYYCP